MDKQRVRTIAIAAAVTPSFEGLQATFVPSKNEPLHSWFPYLEGYSPEFVEAVRLTFMPNAKRIIDPFAGSGTTPLVLSSQGIECGYCEVNPVMQTVIHTKLQVAGLTTDARSRLVDEICDLADSLVGMWEAAKPDGALVTSYGACFPESTFFDSDTFASVLKLRAVCDQLASKSPLVPRILELAILSNLIACSLLKRQGDVRYRTEKELKKSIPRIVPEVVSQLGRMAADCAICPSSHVTPVLLSADAKNLRGVARFGAAGVITSPPYLNGTNYIRNTKLELWFMRQITDSSHLRDIRDKVVTAGICDVTVAKGQRGVTPRVSEIVASLAESAYDRRIPRMVAAYCEDMLAVFLGLHAQTRPGAVICVDIGDSQYGGVHVPTQQLLTEIADAAGLTLRESIRLRSRVSKDRSELSQDLLVFEHKASCPRPVLSVAASWQDRWQWFKDTLPQQRPPYTARNWGHARHSVCSFQGKMKPSIAHFLVECFTETGQRVLDPFSGAGTIPFEASISGRKSYAFDISLMAYSVTSAKLTPPPVDRLEKVVRQLSEFIQGFSVSEDQIESICSVRFNGSIPEYFHRDTLIEILAAREFFKRTRDESPEWAFALACMLHILHGNRPYALSRRSHPITPYAPTGPCEYSSVVKKLQAKISLVLSSNLPDEFVTGTCFQTDILGDWPTEVDELDAIITSPPFFDSTRFYMTNWMRYWFCGWSKSDFDSQPSRFVESLQKESLEVYDPIFRQSKCRLKPGGVFVLHLGQSKKCDMAARLSEIGSRHFKVRDIFVETVEHCEKHGIRDKGTVTAHQYLVLTKEG